MVDSEAGKRKKQVMAVKKKSDGPLVETNYKAFFLKKNVSFEKAKKKRSHFFFKKKTIVCSFYFVAQVTQKGSRGIFFSVSTRG